jgi:hypothetical protein
MAQELAQQAQETCFYFTIKGMDNQPTIQVRAHLKILKCHVLSIERGLVTFVTKIYLASMKET